MVDSEKILSKLKAYEAELSDILNRFEHTRDGIYISEADGSRFRQMVI